MTTNFFSHLSFVTVFGSGIRDPGSGMGKNQDPGSGINIPDPPHWSLPPCTLAAFAFSLQFSCIRPYGTGTEPIFYDLGHWIFESCWLDCGSFEEENEEKEANGEENAAEARENEEENEKKDGKADVEGEVKR